MAEETLPEVDQFLAGAKRLVIGNEPVESASGASFETLNPATGQVLATVDEAERAEIDRAVEAAQSALANPEWRDLMARDRAKLLFDLADAIEDNAEELAQLEALDSGKPLSNTRKTDIPQSVDHIRYFAGWVTKIEGSTIPPSVGNYLIYTRREPVGVCALIVPWNYPLLLASWKFAPALACGNAIILKPAEQTPLTALRVGELAAEVGFPPGVFNVLPGRGEVTGAGLVSHPGVDKVSFTGSTEVGRSIVTASANDLKRISLELGGKSPNMVFADADLDAAASGSAWGIFYNMGEDCAAGSRLLVQESIYDEFLAKVSAVADSIKVGHQFEADSQIGPLITAEHLAKVKSYIDAGTSEGAEVLAGGLKPDGDGFENGYFLRPTVLGGVENSHRAAREEIFGPVVVAIPFKDEDDAIAIANDSSYGLAAGIWTSDVTRSHRVAAAVKGGSVWVNDYGPADSAAPFGGFKESGYGREHGKTALDLYLETKTVWVNLG